MAYPTLTVIQSAAMNPPLRSTVVNEQHAGAVPADSDCFDDEFLPAEGDSSLAHSCALAPL